MCSFRIQPLNWEGTKIHIVDEYKFLGVIFDSKLSFYPSLETSEIKMQQSSTAPTSGGPHRMGSRPANHTIIHRRSYFKELDLIQK